MKLVPAFFLHEAYGFLRKARNEVLSSSTKARDFAGKFTGYFRVPSIQHSLIADLDRRLFLHHKRGESETTVTAILKEDALWLNPPGIEISLDGIFAPACPA